MTTIKKSLLLTDYNGFSNTGEARKKAMHKEGAVLLTQLAAEIGINPTQYKVRSNTAGDGVSGEVTLHADMLYLQMSESCIAPGLQIMYRTCKDQKDYTGGPNHFVSLKDLVNADKQRAFITQCQKFVAQAPAGMTPR